MIDFVNQHIAIGDSSDARDYNAIMVNDIGAVLNVAFDLDIAPYKDIEQAKVGLIDGPGNEVTTLVAAVYMLEQLLKRHDKVLVHCHAGHSRAPTVVGTYVSYELGDDFTHVIADITNMRLLVKPHVALCRLAMEALSQIQ